MLVGMPAPRDLHRSEVDGQVFVAVGATVLFSSEGQTGSASHVYVRSSGAGYHKYSDPARGGKVTGVQLCCAHLLRDLQAVWEADPAGQVWAAQMRHTLTKARRAVDAAVDAGASNLPPGTLAALRGLYANTAEQGVSADAPGVNGRSKELQAGQTHGRTDRPGTVLQRRLDEQQLRAGDQDGQAPGEDQRELAEHARAQGLLPHPFLHRHRPGARRPRLHRAARRLPGQPLEHPSNRVTASVNPRDQGLP